MPNNISRFNIDDIQNLSFKRVAIGLNRFSRVYLYLVTAFFTREILIHGSEAALETYHSFRNVAYVVLAVSLFFFGGFIAYHKPLSSLRGIEDTSNQVTDIAAFISTVLPRLIVLLLVTTFSYSFGVVFAQAIELLKR